MSFKVIVEQEAEADMKDIAHWMAQYSSDKAALWFFDMVEAIESLENFPTRCPLAPESKRFGAEIRHLIFGKYRILFIVEDETVYVLRIRHQAQDVLKPDEEE
ncbi:MAG: type II toxin-antitoxin system RelE/ParE family toxin [Blastocatellales bacterium]